MRAQTLLANLGFFVVVLLSHPLSLHTGEIDEDEVGVVLQNGVPFRRSHTDMHARHKTTFVFMVFPCKLYEGSYGSLSQGSCRDK